MKKLLIIIALILSSFSLYAQYGNNHWGIQASFDINIPSKLGGRLDGEKIDLFRMGYGGSVGAVYSHWFNDVVFLEPGVSLFYDTYSYKNLIIGDGMTNKTESDPSLYKLGVRIPLVVGYSYYLLDTLPMRVYTGPELSYSFAGQVRIKNKSLLEDFDTNLYGKNGFMHPFDFAWKIGIGLDLDLGTVGIDAAFGITDIYKGHLAMRDNRVKIHVTHFF